MAQAKTLTQGELDQVLRYVATTRYRVRNRALVLMSFWSGMRVGEIAGLTIGHVRSEDGSIKQELRLAPDETKGRHSRTVFLNQKLRSEIAAYLQSRAIRSSAEPLFFTRRPPSFE